MAEAFMCKGGLTINRGRVDRHWRERPVRIRRGEHVSVTDRDDTGVTVHCMGGQVRMPHGTWEYYLEAVR